MIHPWNLNMWLSIAIELAVLLLQVGGLTLYQRWKPLAPETSRKLFHVGGGLTVLAFPWAFTSPWPVILMMLLLIPFLLALKYLHVFKRNLGTVLYRVDRTSFGEIYLPLSFCLLFVLTGRYPVMFIIPVLLLTLADSAAAMIGIRYGRLHYRIGKGQKSVEGSTAFFLIAFLCVLIPLLLFNTTGLLKAVLMALLIGLLVTMIEAITQTGLDNLLIPLFSFFLLMILLPLSLLPLFALTIILCLLIILFCLLNRANSRAVTCKGGK
jgi:phytol kinase